MIYRKPLLATIVSLTLAGISAPTASAALIASYNFNNTSATNIPDSSGNGHTGTFTNGGSYNTTDTAPGVGGAGSLVKSFSADVNGFTSFGELTTNNTGTVTLWIKANNANQTAFWLQDASNNRQFQAHATWSDGNTYFDTGGCCAVPTQRLSGANGNDGAWHHWAFVKDGNNKYVYKDGVILLNQNGNDATANIGSIASVLIGSEPAGVDVHTGLIDEVAIFSNALSQAQIVSIKTNGVPVPEPASLGLISIAAVVLRRRAR